MTFATIPEKQKREIPIDEIGCKFCNKSINRIFVEHIQQHIDYEITKEV